MNTNALVNYLTLLRMQHRAARRDMLIAGGFFYLSATSMVAFGLLAE